jgi:double-GTPase-like protein
MNAAKLKTFLVIGESDVGKTHYGAQVLLRLNQQNCVLRMAGAAGNLGPYETAIASLNEGKAAPHTAASVYLESLWPMQDQNQNRLDLVWPDYAGEQIRNLPATRHIPLSWKERVIASDGWIFLVRVQHTTQKEDIFSRPLASIHQSPAADKGFQASDQARMIELIQLLLFLRGLGTLQQISAPALLVLLSCWDEIVDAKKGAKPIEVLAKNLPLLADFVIGNWAEGKAAVWGLSALGKALTETSKDQGYIENGPQSFGYIVKPDGSTDTDLTLPIAQLASMVT